MVKDLIEKEISNLKNDLNLTNNCLDEFKKDVNHL